MESFDVVLHQLLDATGDNPIVSGLTILVLFSLIQDFILFRKLRAFLRGSDGKSLEGTIHKLGERVESLESHARETTNILKEADERLARSVQGIAVKRFDPFQNAGGQQSFATALLSEEGDGVVISGIHARDGVRVYAKEVKKFASERELSDEERDAIAEAKKKVA
jgi:hypothetical protein